MRVAAAAAGPGGHRRYLPQLRGLLSECAARHQDYTDDLLAHRYAAEWRRRAKGCAETTEPSGLRALDTILDCIGCSVPRKVLITMREAPSSASPGYKWPVRKCSPVASQAILKMSLEVREAPGKGRGLFASQPLQGGTVVLQEAPFLLTPQHSAVQTVCHHCLRALNVAGEHHVCKRSGATVSIVIMAACPDTFFLAGCTPQTCCTCTHAVFCTPACAAAAAADPGSHCANVCAWLRACNMTGLSDEQASALQFLFRCVSLLAAAAVGTPGAAERVAALQALAPGPPAAPPPPVTTERAELHGRLRHALAAAGASELAAGVSAQQVAELLARDETNGYGIMAAAALGGERAIRGTGLYARASLVNHECLPNLARFDGFDAPPALGAAVMANTLVQLRALHDIPAGEQLTASYFPLPWDYTERQERCQTQYGFTCTCPRCREEFTWQAEYDDMGEQQAAGSGCGHTHGLQEACAACHAQQQQQQVEHPPAVDPAYISIFIQKFVCPEEDCGGTMAPIGPGADVSECNVCSRRRSEAEFLAVLETEDDEEQE